jgi:hypothetical protein
VGCVARRARGACGPRWAPAIPRAAIDVLIGLCSTSAKGEQQNNAAGTERPAALSLTPATRHDADGASAGADSSSRFGPG